MLGGVLVLHLFGAIYWLGTILVVASMLGRLQEEVGVAKERFIVAARRMFRVGANAGAAVSIASGVALIVIEPDVLRQGWLHTKLLLIVVLLFFHVRLYRRIVHLEIEPSAATR